jgi:hypothetical protein
LVGAVGKGAGYTCLRISIWLEIALADTACFNTGFIDTPPGAIVNADKRADFSVITIGILFMEVAFSAIGARHGCDPLGFLCTSAFGCYRSFGGHCVSIHTAGVSGHGGRASDHDCGISIRAGGLVEAETIALEADVSGAGLAVSRAGLEGESGDEGEHDELFEHLNNSIILLTDPVFITTDLFLEILMT